MSGRSIHKLGQLWKHVRGVAFFQLKVYERGIYIFCQNGTQKAGKGLNLRAEPPQQNFVEFPGLFLVMKWKRQADIFLHLKHFIIYAFYSSRDRHYLRDRHRCDLLETIVFAVSYLF